MNNPSKASTRATARQHQTRDRFVEGVLHGRDKGVHARVLRGLLTPLSWLHRAGLEMFLLPYRVGVRKRYRLARSDGSWVPVIAIGNLSSGGTGKTPMAALVAKRLQSDRCRVVVLSRGYGGTTDHAPRVVSDGEQVLLGASEAGDEPALLARLLPGVPIVIGKDRCQSGRLAVEQFAPDVIVLDDALQFWQLHRDLDIVLLDAARPFDNNHVLPRGLLREPPSHLARAGVVVLTRANRVSPDALNVTRRRLAVLAPRADIFTATHAPIAWVRAGDDEHLPLHVLAGRDVLAFSGIADCGSFVATVEALGARVVALRDFGDHHAYEAADLAELHPPHVDAVVTTEKDLVKVASLWPGPTVPSLYALRIGMKLDDPGRFFERLQGSRDAVNNTLDPG